jgi:16S rRNA (guanine1207-N2)-methyltransferase
VPSGPDEHYFSPSPSARSRRAAVELTLPDVHVELVTDRATFSPDRIDPGTKLLLLEAPPPPPSGDVVDLGCGYGPIAITLARRSPDATVWAVDVNERARLLCEENAARAGVENVRVIAPDDVPPGLIAAAIYSNPPIRIGKAALHELLLEWIARLALGSSAHLVVQKHLGADSLTRWLRADAGCQVERRASRGGYRVLDVTRGVG